MLFELINSSDAYTFRAESIEIAGLSACMLSSGFGARQIDNGDEEGEATPILFGWDEWLKERGIDEAWIDAHRSEIADCYDSFLIGDAALREDIEAMLAELPEEKREAWRASRQDRHRSSMNAIGERAYELAQTLREAASASA